MGGGGFSWPHCRRARQSRHPLAALPRLSQKAQVTEPSQKLGQNGAFLGYCPGRTPYISLRPGRVASLPKTRNRKSVGMLARTKTYRPSDKEFINERRRKLFRTRLLAWRENMSRPRKRCWSSKRKIRTIPISPIGRPRRPTAPWTRQRKLIAKIDEALGASKTAPTAIARRPASRSRCAGWRPAESPRRRSAERHERRERVYRERVSGS